MSKRFSTKPKSKTSRVVKSEVPEKEVDMVAPVGVSSPTNTNSAAPPQEKHNMELTLTLNKNPRKSTRLVIYDGPLNSVQFLRTAFGDVVPETITVSGDFAEPKAPKVKETKEERKARLAAMPKPTLAEKVARAEKRAEELKAKLAKAAQPTA